MLVVTLESSRNRVHFPPEPPTLEHGRFADGGNMRAAEAWRPAWRLAFWR